MSVVEKINRYIQLARYPWDTNKDGRLSIEEIIIHPEAGLTVPNASLSNNNDLLLYQQWYPGIDMDNDNMIDIDNELTPFALTVLSQKQRKSHTEIVVN